MSSPGTRARTVSFWPTLPPGPIQHLASTEPPFNSSAPHGGGILSRVTLLTYKDSTGIFIKGPECPGLEPSQSQNDLGAAPLKSERKDKWQFKKKAPQQSGRLNWLIPGLWADETEGKTVLLSQDT